MVPSATSTCRPCAQETGELNAVHAAGTPHHVCSCRAELPYKWSECGLSDKPHYFRFYQFYYGFPEADPFLWTINITAGLSYSFDITVRRYWA
jgi:hypothetical protein